MDPEEYFERVIRFLETKGWNTDTTQINETIYLVTGTRESESYYDRMMTMVAVDSETVFGKRQMEYLIDAAAEHGVDQVMATTRGPVDESGRAVIDEHDIELIDPGTIDDAFIDEFSIEKPQSPFDQARAESDRARVTSGDPFGETARYLLALYVLVGLFFVVAILLLGTLTDGEGLLTDILVPGALLVAGPLLAVIGSLGVGTGRESTPAVGIFAGTLAGYSLLFVLVGASGGAVGLTGLLTPWPRLLAVLGLAFPVAALGVAVAYTQARLRISTAETR